MSQKIEEHKVPVYLVNTGWIGGSGTSGAKRISIKFTRKMITSILDGTIEKSKYKTDPIFNLDIPVNIDGIPKLVFYVETLGRINQFTILRQVNFQIYLK